MEHGDGKTAPGKSGDLGNSVVARIRLQPSRKKPELSVRAVDSVVCVPGQVREARQSPSGGPGRSRDAAIRTCLQVSKDKQPPCSALGAQKGLRGLTFPISVSLSCQPKGTGMLLVGRAQTSGLFSVVSPPRLCSQSPVPQSPEPLYKRADGRLCSLRWPGRAVRPRRGAARRDAAASRGGQLRLLPRTRVSAPHFKANICPFELCDL